MSRSDGELGDGIWERLIERARSCQRIPTQAVMAEVSFIQATISDQDGTQYEDSRSAETR